MAVWRKTDRYCSFLRLFEVRARFRGPLTHRIRRRETNYDKTKGSSSGLAEKKVRILANDPDDAKIRAKLLLKTEGYDERSLQRVTWTVSRLDRQRDKKRRNGE
jgi:hypothetical protein